MNFILVWDYTDCIPGWVGINLKSFKLMSKQSRNVWNIDSVLGFFFLLDCARYTSSVVYLIWVGNLPKDREMDVYIHFTVRY